MSSIRGAEVIVSHTDGEVQGMVVGVDKLDEGEGFGSHLLTVFDEEGKLHNLSFRSVRDIQFLDAKMQEEMRHLFRSGLSAKKQKSRELRLFCQGQGKRRLTLSYMVESPVWKTSYRVEIQDGQRLLLQGWALVDNPQDEDWENVTLSLACGLPISFRHDLYTPRYVERPEVKVEGLKPPRPVATESEPRAAMMACSSVSSRFVLDEQTVQAKASTKQVGELFEYKIDEPVTVLRNQSALVPILQEELEGRKILFYRSSEREENPYFAFSFRNRDDLTLEGGPVNVYEDGMYAGEAMLNTLGPAEEQIVCYAVALEVKATSTQKALSKRQSLSITEGYFVSKNADYLDLEYKFENRGEKTHTIVVECPKLQEELESGPEPSFETANAWRFELTIAPGSQASLDLRLKSVRTERTDVTACQISRTVSILGDFSERFNNGSSETIKELLTMAEAITTAGRERGEVEVAAANQAKEQNRLRDNLKALGNSQPELKLRGEYVEMLRRDEKMLASLKQKSQQLLEKQSRLEKEIRDRLSDVALSWSE